MSFEISGQGKHEKKFNKPNRGWRKIVSGENIKIENILLKSILKFDIALREEIKSRGFLIDLLQEIRLFLVEDKLDRISKENIRKMKRIFYAFTKNYGLNSNLERGSAQKKYQEKNKEKFLAQQREYYQKNKDKIKARHKIYCENKKRNLNK